MRYTEPIPAINFETELTLTLDKLCPRYPVLFFHSEVCDFLQGPILFKASLLQSQLERVNEKQ